MNSSILLDLALILLVTKILGLLSHKIHFPQITGALLAGVLLGPVLLGAVEPNEIITVIAELGVLLILFEAGLETDLKQLKAAIKPVVLVSVCGIILALTVGFFLSSGFGYGFAESVFVGVLIMSSSLSIPAETLSEMGKLKSKAGTLILGAAIVDDICGVIILSVIIGLNRGGFTLSSVGTTLLRIVLFFIFTAVCGFIAFKLIEYFYIKGGKRRRLSIFGLAFCFLMAFAADRFGLSGIIGAYFAGLVLCNSKAEEYIDSKTSVLSFLFFSPVFFVSVGLNLSFDGLDGKGWLFTVLLIAAAIVSKFLGCGFGAKLSGLSKREAFQAGAGMTSFCEFPIIAAVIGMSMGLVDTRLFSAVVILVIFTTLFAPVLIQIVFGRKK